MISTITSNFSLANCGIEAVVESISNTKTNGKFPIKNTTVK